DFIKNMSPQMVPIVVFVTAYPQYAVQGFEVNATEYLLKPVSFTRFVKAVNKITTYLTFRNKLKDLPRDGKRPALEPKSDEKNFIIVKSDRKIVKLLHNDIYYI